MLQESDVHITFEDQQKINKFARLNAKLEDIKEELKIKEVNNHKLIYFLLKSNEF